MAVTLKTVKTETNVKSLLRRWQDLPKGKASDALVSACWVPLGIWKSMSDGLFSPAGTVNNREYFGPRRVTKFGLVGSAIGWTGIAAVAGTALYIEWLRKY